MEDKFNLTEEEDNKVWTNAFITIRRKEQQKRKRRYIICGGLAAVVLFSSSILGFNILNKPDVYFANSNKLKVLLPDNSEVILQKGAKLTVEKSFPADTRDVKLEGDAVFKVSKSKTHPFIVHGNEYDTKVHGTVFKVIQTGKTFIVNLYEGKVSVSRTDKPNETFILKPDETFSNMGITQVATVVPSGKSAQTNSLPTISFNECSLGKVAEIIEKTYDVKLTVTDQEKDLMITISATNTTAEAFIKTLAYQLNLNLKKYNDKTFQLE